MISNTFYSVTHANLSNPLVKQDGASMLSLPSNVSTDVNYDFVRYGVLIAIATLTTSWVRGNIKDGIFCSKNISFGTW